MDKITNIISQNQILQ